MPYTDNQINFQKISAKLKGSSSPSVAGLELTYSCNVRCRHCYVNGLGGEELTLNEYRRLIDDLYDLGRFCLVFTGGEPLLRPDFFDIVAYANRKRFLKVLFTNGTLIDSLDNDRAG
jgi:MoaA/NifB/PqqE/SkfB family radical SAM enzyme